jgi:protein O-mannosyl-transferase
MISRYDKCKKGGQADTFFNIRLDLLVCLLLILSVLAVYWQVKNYDFVNLDDNVYVTANEHVRSGINLDSITWAFSLENKDHTYWHPVTWLSHMLDCQLYGMSPGMHHSTNLIFHIANTILLFLLFRRMTGEPWKSALVAALFGLHPLNVESVVWISERKNVLSTFFWVLTMAVYVRYSKQPGFYRYLPVFFLFMLGLLAKPMLITLPFILMLLDYWPLRRLKISEWRNLLHLILEKIPLFVISALALYISVLSNQHLGIMKSTEAVPITLRIENALVSYLGYIVKTLWPHNLVVYYSFPDSLPLWQTAGALLLLVCISLTLLLKLKHIPSLGIGWLWYLGTFVPVTGLVQAGLWPAMADRWAYIPTIGIFVIIVWGGSYLFTKWRCRKWVPATTSITLLLLLMATTCSQIRHWENSFTLYRHTLTVTSNDKTIHYNMGVSLSELGRSKEAIVHYRKALDINPAFHKALNNLGCELARQGNDSEAIRYYREALRINPTYKYTHNNLGTALIGQGKLNEAIEHYRKALQADPQFADAHNNLGQAMLRTGEIEAAIFHLAASFQSEPANRIAQNRLIQAMDFHKRIKSAVEKFRKSLQFAPKDPDLADRLDILTKRKTEMLKVIDQYEKTLSFQPDFDRKQLNISNLPQVREAGEEYERALGLFETTAGFQPGNAAALYHAGCVYARKNEIQKSIAWLEIAAKTGFANPELFKMDRDLQDIKRSYYYNSLLEAFNKNAEKLRLNGIGETPEDKNPKKQQ